MSFFETAISGRIERDGVVMTAMSKGGDFVAVVCDNCLELYFSADILANRSDRYQWREFDEIDAICFLEIDNKTFVAVAQSDAIYRFDVKELDWSGAVYCFDDVGFMQQDSIMDAKLIIHKKNKNLCMFDMLQNEGTPISESVDCFCQTADGTIVISQSDKIYISKWSENSFNFEFIASLEIQIGQLVPTSSNSILITGLHRETTACASVLRLQQAEAQELTMFEGMNVIASSCLAAYDGTRKLVFIGIVPSLVMIYELGEKLVFKEKKDISGLFWILSEGGTLMAFTDQEIFGYKPHEEKKQKKKYNLDDRFIFSILPSAQLAQPVLPAGLGETKLKEKNERTEWLFKTRAAINALPRPTDPSRAIAFVETKARPIVEHIKMVEEVRRLERKCEFLVCDHQEECQRQEEDTYDLNVINCCLETVGRLQELIDEQIGTIRAPNDEQKQAEKEIYEEAG